MKTLIRLQKLAGHPGLLMALLASIPAKGADPNLGSPSYSGGQFSFAVQGESKAGYIVLTSTNLPAWTPLATNQGAAAVRRIALPATPDNAYFKVQRMPLPLFRFALAAQQIDLKGNNFVSDSFDSSDPNYSDNGTYDPAKAKDGGDIASFWGIINSLGVGSAYIYGHIFTGAYGTVSIGPNGSVGDLAWHNAGNSGIEPGFSANDMNVSLPDAQLPFTGGAFTPSAGYITNVSTTINPTAITTITYPVGDPVSVTTNFAVSPIYPSDSPGPVFTNWNAGHTKINGYTYPTFTANYGTYTTNVNVTVTYYDYILGDGNHQLSSLNGSLYVQGDAVLLVTSIANPTSITIAEGKSLQLYNQSPSFSLSGSLVLNGNGTASEFAYYGLPGNTSMSINGGGAFVGTIYAPDAALTLGGGGNNIYDFIGSAVANTISLNGHFNFHFDENLQQTGPFR